MVAMSVKTQLPDPLVAQVTLDCYGTLATVLSKIFFFQSGVTPTAAHHQLFRGVTPLVVRLKPLDPYGLVALVSKIDARAKTRLHQGSAPP